MGSKARHQGKYRSSHHARAAIGGRTTMQSVLMKRKQPKSGATDPSGEATGEVDAEDIQNDSEYVHRASDGNELS